MLTDDKLIQTRNSSIPSVSYKLPPKKSQANNKKKKNSMTQWLQKYKNKKLQREAAELVSTAEIRAGSYKNALKSTSSTAKNGGFACTSLCSSIS